MVYGTNAFILVEIELTSPRVMAFSEWRNSDCLRENLDLLDELREKTVVQLAAYQRKIAIYYNTKVRP